MTDLAPPLQRRAIAELRRRTARRGSRKRVAHEIGLSQTTICQVLAGKQAPSLRLAIGLGLVNLAPAFAGAEPGEPPCEDQLQMELRAE